MPPEWMWPFDTLIVDWFQQVKEKRAAEARGEKTAPMVEGPMIENEYAKGRGRNAA